MCGSAQPVLFPSKGVLVQASQPRIATLLLSASLALATAVAAPTIARAATYEELQQRVEEATAAYDEAVANVEKIAGEIKENEAKIDKLEAELPVQKARAAESLRTLYKMQQSSGGLVEFVLSADDFNDFVATVVYLDRIQNKNISELQELGELVAELQEAKDTLSARKAQADHEAEAARQAQEDSIAAREEVRQQAIAQALAEQAEAQAAIEQAAREAEEGKTFTNASGQEVTVSVPEDTTSPAETVNDDPDESDGEETPTDDGSADEEAKRKAAEERRKKKAEEKARKEAERKKQEEQAAQQQPVMSEREAFVAKWAPRIDDYLAGYPLGGHGRTFAEAAWDYNVDPRWSPAISCVESTKGLYCFKSHNAWGWGSSSWGDWDSAIRNHVAGLASIYGYTITPSAAKMYCPPTWSEWYSSVLSEMNCI